MIWFACKSCGKRHGRADNLAGTMVFCDCGQGNRIPWSSTVPEPEPSAEPPPEPARAPLPPPPGPAPLPPRRPRELRRINPAYCLNHDEDPSQAVCDACRCSFCADCLVTLQGATLCGACKNFRVRGLHHQARIAPLAIAAFVVAMLSGPVTFLLTLMAIGTRTATDGAMPAALLICVVALVLPAGAFALSWAALRQIDTTPGRAGRALAATGATTALAGLLWSQAIALLIIVKHFQD